MTTSTKLRVGVVGVGHLGKQHARIYAQNERVQFAGVADVSEEAARAVAAQHRVPYYTETDALLPHVDAVSIVVPTPLHLQAARPYLEAGKGVLVEKPLAATLEEADEIVALADRYGATLQVGHIERFNPVVEAALPRVVDPLFIECDRLHPFSLRSTDVSVVLDLMIHDIDLVLHLTQDEPEQVEALGARVLTLTEDLANARLIFRNGCVAMVKASRVAMNRTRKLRVFCRRSYLTLDLVTKSGMYVKLRDDYDPARLTAAAARGVPGGEAAFLAEQIETEILAIPDKDALFSELDSFITAVERRSTPIVTGRMGRQAMAVADRVLRSIAENERRFASARASARRPGK